MIAMSPTDLTGLRWLATLPPVVAAATQPSVEALRGLLEAGGADTVDESGWSALHAAATFDRLGAVELLLRAGATVDAPDEEGFTPLINAAPFASVRCLQVL